jgi:hypothetical protein
MNKINEKNKTVGETIFETYCQIHNYLWKYELGNPNDKKPDYLVTINNKNIMYVEMKDFEEGPVDTNIKDQLEKNNSAEWDFINDEIYSRVRIKIIKAAKQFNSVFPLIPCVVAMYKTDKNYATFLSENIIFGSMYGNIGIISGGRSYDKKKSLMSDNSKNIVSAVMTLDRKENAMIYHNYFSKNPLPISTLSGKHYYYKYNPYDNQIPNLPKQCFVK